MSADRDDTLSGGIVTAPGATPGGPIATTAHDAPTQQFGLTAVGDRCVACGAPLSSDQRYCVNCGERRSPPRFSLPEPAVAPVAVTRVRRRPRVPSPSTGGTLVAGIGTLLLAMGVGVLIGRTNNGSRTTASTPKVQVVQVGGGGSNGNAGASGGGGNAGTNTGKKSTARSNLNPTTKSRPSPAVTAKAAAAATKVLGGKHLPPATVTVGQPGKGPGFQSGHFTGTFFGQ